jgi:hypothetical protein
MRRNLILSFLVTCSAVAQTVTVYDLKTDWSESANPNGVWRYRAGTTNLVHAADWTGAALGYTQPVWTTSSTPRLGAFLPAIFRATGTKPGDDYAIGDIVIHSNSPGNGNDTDVANVAWTAPFNAVINITGELWQTGLRTGAQARNNTAVLHLNAVTLQQVANLAGFSSSSPASLSVSNLSVRQGDVLSLDIIRSLNSEGYIVNANLHIVATAALPSLGTAILPQFAYGGGWYSALYFANVGTTPVSFPVNFIGDNGQPLNVPSVGGSSTTVNLSAQGTAVLEAPNQGGLSQGYVTASLPVGVVGYGIFRQSVASRGDQEAVVPLSGATATTSTLIWDDTNFVTGVAIVNRSSLPNTVAIVLRDSAGTTIGNATVNLPPNGKLAVALRDLPGVTRVAGARGMAEFTVPFGNVAVLGLRFSGSAFTSIPTADR